MKNTNLKEMFKKAFSNKTFVYAFLASLVSFFLILIIGFGIVWIYRANVFGYFAKEYLRESKLPSNSQAGAVTFEKQSILSQESLVVDAVKKSSPAVVSIILSQNVPKYQTCTDPNGQNRNPFEDLFPGLPNNFFNIPQYCQNGTQKKDIGGGSGFFVSSNGLIVTNKHVVDQLGVDYTVYTNDGKKHTAKVIAKDPILDVALIKIDGSDYPPLSFGNSDNLQVGQSVIAIGNALGEFRNSVSVGVVSGLTRSITAGDTTGGGTETLDHVIQTDAAINPGNSGGPLLDLSGRVIGINVAIAQGSQNVGFALPVNSIEGSITSVKNTGKIIRPYLGVRYISITPEIKDANKLSVDYGVLVKPGNQATDLAVIPGSPADKAGIVENDILLEVNGVKIDDQNSLAMAIRSKNVGDAITLKILHRGVEKTVQVTLEAAK